MLIYLGKVVEVGVYHFNLLSTLLIYLGKVIVVGIHHFKLLRTLLIYLGKAGGSLDSAVIASLESFFEQNIHNAEEQLRQVVDKKACFTYASTVLFPETFIHQQEVMMGKSREEAEAIFLQVEVGEEEREALRREIKESAKRQEEEEEKDFEEEWVDHSDIEE